MAFSETEDKILLDVKDGTLGVSGILVLRGVTDEALLIGEGNVGRGDTVSLVIDENLDLAVLHHTNTTAIEVSKSMVVKSLRRQNLRVGGSQIDTNNLTIALRGVLLLGVGGVSKECQRCNKNEEKVEDSGPSERLGRAIACRDASHGESECVYVEFLNAQTRELKPRALLE